MLSFADEIMISLHLEMVPLSTCEFVRITNPCHYNYVLYFMCIVSIVNTCLEP